MNFQRNLLIEQMDSKLKPLSTLNNLTVPSKGWIASIRRVLRMSLKQLGTRLNVSPQAALQMEKREVEGSLTLKLLREAGEALNMQLVYGFIPKEGSIEAMIERRALELAKEIVLRTSNTMKLEDQENSNTRIERAIKNKADEIKRTLPKYLWD